MNVTGLESILTFGAGRGCLDSTEFQCENIIKGPEGRGAPRLLTDSRSPATGPAP